MVASVYAAFCSPPSPSAASLDLSARFILVFLCIDDADDGDVASAMSADATALGALGAGFDAWRNDLDAMGGSDPAVRAHLESSFAVYLRARKTEAALARAGLTIDAHWSLRRATIFMDPYIDQWMISTRIDPPGLENGDCADARRLCIDIVLLANDLGSVGRDEEDGDAPGDLNLVQAYRRWNGHTAEQAIEELVALHDSYATQFDAALASVRAGSSAHAEYAALLRGLVDGNLRALRMLAFRYPGAGPTLDRLQRTA